jgi:hypothetical protein
LRKLNRRPTVSKTRSAGKGGSVAELRIPNPPVTAHPEDDS